MNIPFDWIAIHKKIEPGDTSLTYRSKVFGGWIVRGYKWVEASSGNEVIALSMIFVPDINHDWEIERE